jgi:putative ABC transport system substrate-binding protein
MIRREFITLLGGAAAAWPPAARAQQPERTRRIGVLMGYAESDSEAQANIAGFREGLQKLGWSEGRNLRIDTRFAAGSPDQFPVLAKELVAMQPDVILAHSPPIAAALQHESRAIPIVFVSVSDPIGAGFVESLARPGGNITGMLQYEAGITGKWLAMLKEIAPGLGRVMLLGNPKTTAFDYFQHSAEALAPSLSIEVVPGRIETPAEIERAIAAFTQVPNGGLLLPPDSTTILNRDLVVALAARRRLPRFTRSVSSSRPADSCHTGPTKSKYFGRPHRTSIASCTARRLPTFRCRRRPSTKRPSTSRRQRRSAWTCRLRCSCAPTR